mmetsp:Transcript_20089/g.64089  ORF Transcript_20089/g.64089 Transcript_20089/m.64089 type:complete len:287 (-) Transcript_20089:598-1458(-)
MARRQRGGGGGGPTAVQPPASPPTGGRALPVQLRGRTGGERRALLRLRAGGRNGAGQDAAEHHAAVDAAQAGPTRGAHCSAGGDRVPEFTGRELGAGDQEVAGQRAAAARVRAAAARLSRLSAWIWNCVPGADRVLRDVPQVQGRHPFGQARAADLRRGPPPQEQRRQQDHRCTGRVPHGPSRGAHGHAGAERPGRVLRGAQFCEPRGAGRQGPLLAHLRGAHLQGPGQGGDGGGGGAGAGARGAAERRDLPVPAPARRVHPAQAPAAQDGGCGVLQAAGGAAGEV